MHPPAAPALSSAHGAGAVNLLYRLERKARPMIHQTKLKNTVELAGRFRLSSAHCSAPTTIDALC